MPCPPGTWPTPRSAGPANSAPSTPTSGSNGSGSANLNLRDAQLDSASDSEDIGLAVRVVHNGAWGFAAGIDRTPDGAARLAEQAVATAKLSKVLSREPVVLAPEPVLRRRGVDLGL